MKDYSASVLTRLLNHSRKHKEEYQSLLIRYVAERFLYRLGKSPFYDCYVLKGAYLLTITLENQTYRTTKDIDFLKTGATDKKEIKESLKQICSIEYPKDAVIFNTDTISLQDIREQNNYHGQRAKIQANIGKARVIIQIDIGIGDSVFPCSNSRQIPSLLEFENACVESYPIETVIAEKIEASVTISLLTSRMKDFYDIYVITQSMSLKYALLSSAIKRTFDRRNTLIPTSMPVVFTEKILHDPIKQKQWAAFVKKLRNENSNLDLSKVIHEISRFSEVFWKDHTTEPVIWTPGSGWK
ncbi:MAG: nucleotidyl transferase AbiEii/AbiGii toxin family protein [Spirochaetales bacterium]|nr:nucleotidyl transferase AbiEii/AbiGii toxin family protein [Spirochaetales bacterium]